jgi:putative IMPACT (imprinted ancient) family translation regulator
MLESADHFDVPTDCRLTIIHGEISRERKSSFQSHICEVHCVEDVQLFRTIVLSNKRIASATHNIFAYRFTINNLSHHDFDDDGEAAAGGRLAEMMRLMKVDNVAVIVSRWFGGILLGPDRFKFICNSARKLLEDNGFAEASRVSHKKSSRGH